MFALTNVLLGRSEAFRFALSPPPGVRWPPAGAADWSSAVVDAGLPVVFFPEGTTSNGAGLLKFHSGLLAQVIEAGSPVTAAYVQYGFSVDNGPAVSVEDDVCYWGDRNMLTHVFKFLGLRGVRAEVRFANEPIEFATWPNRKQAAVEARSEVMELSVKAQ